MAEPAHRRLAVCLEPREPAYRAYHRRVALRAGHHRGGPHGQCVGSLASARRHPKAEAAKTAQAKITQTNTAPAKSAEATVPEAKAASSGAKASAASAPSMAMTIGLVRIVTGTADYADFSMQPNFATGIQDLHGTIEGLSSDPSSRANVGLKGKVDRYAPVDISGVVNLLSATTYTDITMKFRGLELTRMTPYSVRFAGYKIASGTLDADLHYKVDHGILNADHKLVIDQLQLGDQVPSPHATKLPLRLAVALLKDRDGVIRLGLPVTGSLNNPQFSLGPLIGKALLHLLEKAVTAPFALLGHAFGGGPDLNRIDFAPGSATLLPAAQARVAALAKALAQRPQLQLQVPAVFAADVDRPALAKRQLRRRADHPRAQRGRRWRWAWGRSHGRQQVPKPTAGKEVLELPGEHYRLLRAAYQNAFGPKAPLPASAQKVPPYEPAILEMQSSLAQADAGLRCRPYRLLASAARRRSVRPSWRPAASLPDGSRSPRRRSQPATAGRVAVKLGLK